MGGEGKGIEIFNQLLEPCKGFFYLKYPKRNVSILHFNPWYEISSYYSPIENNIHVEIYLFLLTTSLKGMDFVIVVFITRSRLPKESLKT
jgi:hypothetical protein